MTFFNNYFEYVGETEAPLLYHRWSMISALGAMLGRNVWLPFGHSEIYPNQYIMLMGSPGARKSSAIGIAKKLIEASGYKRFAPDRLSKERFLMEMKPHTDEELDADLEHLVFDQASELYVVAEEFTDFVGHGGMEFMTMLTKLWDNMGRYEHPKIHGKSVVVEKPTVNILGGNTVQGLALALPPEALGNGFMSRVIFVHSEATGKKITFPKPISMALKQSLINHLIDIKEQVQGEFTYSEDSLPLFDRMYKEFQDVDDPRFKSYSTRRFTHLLKLSLILAATELRTVITREDALNANTLLHYTETRMPKALGEFGKSKYSDTAHVVLEALAHTLKPMTVNELFKVVARDITKMSEIGDILKNLMAAEKIQVVTIKGKQGYMPLFKEAKEWCPTLINPDYLTNEEMH